ncbi:unnamed protein product, partial [Didymodactylos carnosus]
MTLLRKFITVKTYFRYLQTFYNRTPAEVRYRAKSRMLITQKIDTPEYRSIITPQLSKLIKLFKENNYELRIAGGAVRDILMNIQPHDVDFATTATPDQMKDIFTKANIRLINSNGEKHGTITCRVDDLENFEVTTLRVDVVTDGRHAVVEFVKDFALDASRRDLTVNALYLDFDGIIYDYFNGIDDLKNRRIRFVGDPVHRIQEDYLRILRYFRFYGRLAEYPNSHEESTLTAIRENAVGLKEISGERLWSELRQIAEGRFAGPVIRKMLEQNIGIYLGIPPPTDLDEFEKHCEKCKESKPRAATILTKLFRNIQELETFEMRMKYSNETKRLSQLLVTYRDITQLITTNASSNRLKAYKDLVIDLVVVDPSAKEKVTELLKYQGHTQLYSELEQWKIPKFPISGGMLALKGIKQGPNYKIILNELKEIWKESNYEKTEKELLENCLPSVLEKLSNSTTTTEIASTSPPAFASV